MVGLAEGMQGVFDARRQPFLAPELALVAGAVIQQPKALARCHCHVGLHERDDLGVVACNGPVAQPLAWQARRSRSCLARPRVPARPSRDAPGPEFSVYDVLERMAHEPQVGIHTFELEVLVLQMAQPRQPRDGHARGLGLPLVVRWLAHAVLPARLADLRTHLYLLGDTDYLGFTESGSLHLENPSGGMLHAWVAQVIDRLQLVFIRPSFQQKSENSQEKDPRMANKNDPKDESQANASQPVLLPAFPRI